jgi:hypothetical protein
MSTAVSTRSVPEKQKAQFKGSLRNKFAFSGVEVPVRQGEKRMNNEVVRRFFSEAV